MFLLKNAGRTTVAVFVFALFLTRCTSPDPFGKELFEGDAADFLYTDTLTLEATILPEDSVNTALPDTYFLGKMDDAIFGKSEAILNTLFRPTVLDYTIQKMASIDSIYMFVYYDAPRCYGDSTKEQTIEVWQLKDQLNADSLYFSHSKAEAAVKVGEATFFPHPRTVTKFIDTTNVLAAADTLKGAFFKIKLEDFFAQQIMALDTAEIETTTKFFEKMKGLQLRATTPNSPFVFSVDMDNLTFSRITIGYKQADGKSKLFHMSFRTNKYVEFKHDRTGSTVGQNLGQRSDSLMYLQGMAGLRVRINVPFAKNLKDIVINKADLELTMPNDAASTGDVAIFKPATQLFFTERNSANTKNVLTSDVIYSTGIDFASGFSRFGGTLETKNGYQTYRLALSDRLQGMVEGTKTSDFFLNLYPQDRTAQRVVLFGPKADQSVRAKIVVKYTKLP